MGSEPQRHFAVAELREGRRGSGRSAPRIGLTDPVG